MSTALLQIGDVAERVGLSLRTIRYYEEQGLVVPEARTDGGFRLYTETQIERLLLVKKMKPLSFSLDDMRAMFEARDTLADAGAAGPARTAAAEAVGRFADEVERRTAKMRRVLEQSDRFLEELRALRP